MILFSRIFLLTSLVNFRIFPLQFLLLWQHLFFVLTSVKSHQHKKGVRVPLHLTVGRSSSLKTPGAGNSNDSWLNWINFHNFWISFHPLHFYWIRFHPAKLDQFASFSHCNLNPETWISSQFVDLICDCRWVFEAAAMCVQQKFWNLWLQTGHRSSFPSSPTGLKFRKPTAGTWSNN